MKEMKAIAHIRSDFRTKFGIPRQSGVVDGLRADVVFAPEYAIPEALRGLEGYSHIWLIWGFSETERDGWSPTVRPPHLGGNTRMGVFATRSPFCPNAIGLSSVRLEGIDLQTPDGPVLHVSGADLMDGTPIYDIKPYLPFTDSHPDARSGFSGGGTERLTVRMDEGICARLGSSCETVRALLAQDPRPSYQQDPNRVYAMEYANYEIRFTVEGQTLTVVEVLGGTQ